MSGMPGPVGETATAMLQQYEDKFGDKLPGVTKTGVEGAIGELGELSSRMEQVLVTLLQGSRHSLKG